jgi:hypothetical protein
MNDCNEIQRIRVNRNVWKNSLTKEIIHLEDNLDQIYYTAGLKPHRIVKDEGNDESSLVDSEKGITNHVLRDYESIIDEQVGEIVQAADNICTLISSVTEFDLPIPVLVLLKLSNRIGSIRCPDFKKKVPGTLARKYVFNKRSLNLIETSLTLYKWISSILSTNILPFQPFINQNLFNLLAWTRTSNLYEHDKEEYFKLRRKIIGILTDTLEQLSLNTNLDSNQLTVLIEEELINCLGQYVTHSNAPKAPNGHVENARSTESVENDYACEVLKCLDRLYNVYADFLSPKLELNLKNFVIHTCIETYRDFDQNSVVLSCRRQLLRLLETISNRPFANSTTELAWHIFELCDRLESDPEIRYIARHSIKNGLAHRPTVVSHYEVYDCYARKCDIERISTNELPPRSIEIPRAESVAEPEAEQGAEQEAEQQTEQHTEQQTEQQAEQQAERQAEQQAEQEAEQQAEPEAGPEAEPKVGPGAEPEAEPEVGLEAEPKVGPEAEPEAEPEVGPEAEPEAGPEPDPKFSEPYHHLSLNNDGDGDSGHSLDGTAGADYMAAARSLLRLVRPSCIDDDCSEVGVRVGKDESQESCNKHAPSSQIDGRLG